MPRSLETLQRGFVAAVTRADPAPDFAATVRGGGRLTPEAAVAVYRRAYPARLSEALGETYARVWRVLGDADFLAACRDYAYARPSVSHNLSDYGYDFPEFLEQRAELAHAPFIGDLARLEWAFKDVFHAPREESLSVEALASASSPGSRFVFGRASALLSLGHRVHAMWSRDLSDETPIESADWEGEEAVFLYKSRDGVCGRTFSAPEAAALSALRAGETLEAALAGAAGLDEAATTELFRWLSESGVVVEAR